ncbi:hypothetical protein [Spirosoma flavum]|uniref:Uncharacterized protein n=1 Tax=Spirosoma flavum TaxID=2048557 RepID=A0ABW6AQ02_9BACT
MKAFLMFAAVVLALAQAIGQVVPLPDQTIYPGNPFALNIVITRVDSSATATSVLNYGTNGPPVEQPNQPIVSRSGRLVTISWSAAQTKSLPGGQRLWLEIKAGAVVKQGAFVTVSKFPIKVTQPGTFTVANPVAELSETGSTGKVFTLNNVPSTGFRVTHNKGTRLVQGVFFRDDTGQIDTLWRIQIVTDNAVDVFGPPGEVFPGRLLLLFPIQTISN